jgi:hypothetical protein
LGEGVFLRLLAVAELLVDAFGHLPHSILAVEFNVSDFAVEIEAGVLMLSLG